MEPRGALTGRRRVHAARHLLRRRSGRPRRRDRRGPTGPTLDGGAGGQRGLPGHLAAARAGAPGRVVLLRPPRRGPGPHRLGAMRYRPTAAPGFAQRWFPDGADAAALARAPNVEFDRTDELQHRYLRRRTRAAVPPPVHHVPSSGDFLHSVRLGFKWGMVPDLESAADELAGTLVTIDREDTSTSSCTGSSGSCGRRPWTTSPARSTPLPWRTLVRRSADPQAHRPASRHRRRHDVESPVRPRATPSPCPTPQPRPPGCAAQRLHCASTTRTRAWPRSPRTTCWRLRRGHRGRRDTLPE